MYCIGGVHLFAGSLNVSPPFLRAGRRRSTFAALEFTYFKMESVRTFLDKPRLLMIKSAVYSAFRGFSGTNGPWCTIWCFRYQLGGKRLRQAIVSDIHGNIHALEAVLEDIKSNDVDEICCLGDVVGYGPKPRSCLAVAFDFIFTLMGNHEEAVLYGALGFNDKARQAIEWTKERLLSGAGSDNDGREVDDRKIWDFLGGLKNSETQGDFFYAHGSPREPTREYIFVQDRFDHQKMDELFAAFDQQVCFVGHTHIPGVFEEPYSFVSPADCESVYTRTDKKIIVNVGSVGQPRDGDPRACYVIADEETIAFRRVEYDIDAVLAEFAETPLPEYLSRRLKEGR